MLDRDLTDANDAQGIPQYLDGTDPGEDIDAAALKYVIGYETEVSASTMASRYMSVDDIISEDEFEDITEIPVELQQGSQTDSGRSDSSWRETVQTEDRKTYKKKRTTERNMRAMSHLWNRLFPINYDSLPIAEYKVIDGVPQLASLGGQGQFGDAETIDMTMLGGGIASAATVAGLGLGGVAQGTEGVSNVLTQAIQSDTSNEDTVMIGNSALSDMLSHLKLHRKTSQEEQEDAFEDIKDAIVEETPEDIDLPEELTTLYDDAMGMLSSVDEQKPDEHQDGFDEAEAALISQMDLDDVSIPADGDIVETNVASSDYRGNSEPQDIYESDEWKAIAEEIKQSKEAVKTGLERLDDLAGIAMVDSMGEEPQGEVDKDTTESSTDTSDSDASDSDTVEEPEGTEATSEPDSGEEGETTKAEDEAVPAGDQTDVTSDASEGQQAKHPSFLSRIVGIFKKREKPVSDTAEEDATEVTESDTTTSVAEQLEDSEDTSATATVEQAPGEQGETNASSSLADATTSEADETLTEDLTETATPSSEGTQAETPTTETGTQAITDTGDDIIPIGEDYRKNYRENYRSEDRQSHPSDGDDDIITMKDDTGAQDYRSEIPQTDRPTEPMPRDEVPAGAITNPSVIVDPSVRMQSLAQRIAISDRGTSESEASKARRQGLELDASPELMLPLPLAKDGQIDANIRVKTTEFLSPKRLGIGARSTHVKLSVKPSKARQDAVSILPVGTGYVPEKSPVGRRLREQGRYEYEPVRRIGETLPQKAKTDQKTEKAQKSQTGQKAKKTQKTKAVQK